MAERDALTGPGRPLDISFQSLVIGRLIDRLCRAPGTYAITIVIPVHRRAHWQVSLFRHELLWTREISR